MPRVRRPADGRANNGGARQGAPGKAYPNRTDMAAQPVATAKGQAYGKAGAQAASQAAVPLAGAPLPPPAGAAPAQGPIAGEGGDLLRPTERPDEPVTHGAPFGPGAGPEAMPPQGDTTLAQLQAYYSVFPSQDLADLIEDLMMGQGFDR